MSARSLKCLTAQLPLPLVLVCSAHFRVSTWRVNTHKASFLALITLQTPTDGDVEAINAEGGTPTLPETMLLGVGFHRSAAVQFALTPFAVFHCLLSVTVCCFYSVWVPLLQEGEKKKKKRCRSRTLLDAGGPSLATSCSRCGAGEFILTTWFSLCCSFFLFLSSFLTPQQAHFR